MVPDVGAVARKRILYIPILGAVTVRKWVLYIRIGKGVECLRRGVECLRRLLRRLRLD